MGKSSVGTKASLQSNGTLPSAQIDGEIAAAALTRQEWALRGLKVPCRRDKLGQTGPTGVRKRGTGEGY